MRRIVLKFPIEGRGKVMARTPIGSRALHFGIDAEGQFCVWVECFTHNAKAFQESDHFEVKTWHIFATGEEFEFAQYSGEHVQTVIVDSPLGAKVWHVYEGAQ